MKFLKLHDKSLAFIQKKITQVMGPLVKIWSAIDGARKGQEENDKFSVMDMLKLVEQVVVLVGQANATCLYERRLNFLAKIMKGVKKAKEQLKTYEHDLAQEADTLYGDTIYKALDRRCKSRKRAREISREIQSKRRRFDQPFRGTPSCTNSQGHSQGRGGRVSYQPSKQSGQGPKRGSGSGFRIPRKNRTGDSRYESKRGHTSSFTTNSKNLESEQTTCLSKSDRIQRNSSKQHSPTGKIKTLSRKLEIDNKRQILVGEYFRIQDRISCKANSNKFTISKHPIREGKKYSKFGSRGNDIKESSGVCSVSDSRSVCQSFVCAPQERRGNETDLQPEKPEPIRDLQSLQDGRLSGCEKSHTNGGLAMQSGSQGCILLHTNPLGSQKVSEVSSQRADATVSQSPIRTGIRPTAFHKNYETDHCPTQANRSPSSDLLRRHIVAKSITRRAAKRQRHFAVAPSQSGLACKLEKISLRSQSSIRIPRSDNRLIKNGDNSFRNKSGRHKTKMFKSTRQGKCINSGTSKFNRYIKCHRRGSYPSFSVRKRVANFPDQMPSEITRELSENDCSSTNMQRGNNLVDPTARSLEWETNQNVSEPRSNNRDRCLKNGVGSSLSHSISKNGGPWTPSEKELHINALEMKAVQFAVQSMTKESKNIHVHIKSDNKTTVAHLNKMGGTHSGLLLKITKEIWSLCLSKQIMLTAEYLPGKLNTQADSESRHMKDSSNWMLNQGVFKQINQRWGPLEMDLFADRLNTQLQQYMSWRPDPQSKGTDAFQIPWQKIKGYAFPPFCLITRYLAKEQK